MEFRLDAGQIDLQRTVERFCADRFPLDAIVERSAAPVQRADWDAFAQLGVFGLLASERRGGTGLGLVEATIVFEQLGSFLVPGPLLWSVATAELVDEAAAGTLVVGGVDADAVTDSAATVEHATELDALLVLERESIAWYDASRFRIAEELHPFDPATPVARVHGLDGGTRIGGPAEARRLRLAATVLAAAMLAGIAERALTTARDYALDRHQFGVPIGSFQAVKHSLADMYVRSTLAQSATYAAAAVADEPGDDDPVRAAAAAKLLAAEAAVANASAAVQILGGMGFTWDMLPNFLLKRAWLLDHTLGGQDHCALQLAAAYST